MNQGAMKRGWLDSGGGPGGSGAVAGDPKFAVPVPSQLAQRLTVEVLAGAVGLAALSTEYAQLRTLAGISLPFMLHDWHLVWANRFLADNRRIHDNLFTYVFRNATGQCVGLVPMVRTCRAVGPLKFVSLDVLGADKAITEIRMPLIDPGYTAAVAGLLQRELQRQGDWDWIQWTGVDPHFVAVLESQPGWQQQEPLLNYILDLPRSWEELRKNLKRNIRESLRHCYNSLKRDGLEFQFVAVSAPDAVPAALERFLELHAMRAALEGTVTHPNHFAGKVVREFLFDACGRLAAQDRVRVFQLIIGDRVVATRIGFIVDDSLYLYYSGYEPDLARYSVMTTTLAEIIKWAIGQGLATVNFSTGKDTSKLRWGPREIPLARGLQIGPRLKSRLAYGLRQRLRDDGGMAWLSRLFGRTKRNWS